MTQPFQPQLALEPGQPAQAHLTNMSVALRTMLDCIEAPEGSPRLSVFYGPSGYGKSVAAAFCAGRFDAAFVEAKSVWAQRSILEAIALELGVSRLARTNPKILQQIIDALLHEPRPLIIDEMDHLVKKQSVEVIRDIHDGAGIPIMMIGEEALPAKLKEWERFDNRILVASAAHPASLDDGLKLRDHYCARVAIADDLVAYFVAATKGVTRRVVTNLQQAQRIALEEGADLIDRAWWGRRPVLTGDVQLRRAA
ncbi:AAA family ATPase [Sphingomonas changnyeongensis]|uniref:AAA family ATPase n=1 Tax=Sphingomonas changnyeongensis TaxID=2698679 RepID=A0A7Z2NWL7_9SPHN|nr:ATP-binding protein [Sphingomonas changnyeongensis]QHL90685.1 AAA family ATPase [Sphingomonas changnyeongensis]